MGKIKGDDRGVINAHATFHSFISGVQRTCILYQVSNKCLYWMLPLSEPGESPLVVLHCTPWPHGCHSLRHLCLHLLTPSIYLCTALL